jgi:hypothetical protein
MRRSRPVQHGESRAQLEGPTQTTVPYLNRDLVVTSSSGLQAATCLVGGRIHRGSALPEPGRVRYGYGRCPDAARASALRPLKDGLCGRLASG